MSFSYEEICGGHYKYRLTADYVHELDFEVTGYHTNKWATMIPRRILILKDQFQWDGVSFPMFPQNKKTARASAVHDALTQLAKLGYCTRLQADREFRKVLIEDGVNRFTAEFFYRCVRAYAQLKY